MLSRPVAAIVFGAVDVLVAALLALGVFVGLPVRWAPVDVVAVGLIAVKLVSGGALLAGLPWAPRAAMIAAAVSLVIGCALVTTLALTASWLAGVYGPVGRGGSVIFILVVALVMPYMVVFPAIQIAWFRR
jgi:hypothetical protein